MTNDEQGDIDNKDSNLISAMNHVAENTSMSVSPMQKSDDAPAEKQVLIRATEHDRDRWKNASRPSSEILPVGNNMPGMWTKISCCSISNY